LDTAWPGAGGQTHIRQTGTGRLRWGKVLKAVFPQVAETCPRWNVLAGQVPGCLGEENLPTVPRGADSRGPMDT